MGTKSEKKTTYGITLTKFDTQYEDCVITRPSIRGVIDLADKIVRCVTKDDFSLSSALNTMQSEALYNNGMAHLSEEERKNYCFNNKYEIPFYFINLLLKPYNLKIGIVEVRYENE